MKNREITKPFFSPAQKKNDPTSAQKFRFYPNDKVPVKKIETQNQEKQKNVNVFVLVDADSRRPAHHPTDARQIQQY